MTCPFRGKRTVLILIAGLGSLVLLGARPLYWAAEAEWFSRKERELLEQINPEWEDQPKAIVREVLDRRLERIKAELKGLEEHDWAGAYFCGNGFGLYVGIWVAPRSGLMFSSHGCMGLHEWNVGDVASATPERIFLRLRRPEVRKMFGHQFPSYLSSELIRVRWGSRRYLIPRSQMVNFCHAVNEGAEPCAPDVTRTRFPLRAGDQNRPASGQPPVPQEYERHLLREPIGAVILASGPAEQMEKNGKLEGFRTFVTLDAGSDAGLLPGMRLTVCDPPEKLMKVTVIATQTSTSHAEYQDLRAEKPEFPEPGWKVSTRDWVYQ